MRCHFNVLDREAEQAEGSERGSETVLECRKQCTIKMQRPRKLSSGAVELSHLDPVINRHAQIQLQPDKQRNMVHSQIQT